MEYDFLKEVTTTLGTTDIWHLMGIIAVCGLVVLVGIGQWEDFREAVGTKNLVIMVMFAVFILNGLLVAYLSSEINTQYYEKTKVLIQENKIKKSDYLLAMNNGGISKLEWMILTEEEPSKDDVKKEILEITP